MKLVTLKYRTESSITSIVAAMEDLGIRNLEITIQDLDLPEIQDLPAEALPTPATPPVREPAPEDLGTRRRGRRKEAPALYAPAFKVPKSERQKHPKVYQHPDGLVTRQAEGSFGQGMYVIDYDATLKNLGLTEEQILDRVWPRGSPQQRLKISMTTSRRRREAEREVARHL